MNGTITIKPEQKMQSNFDDHVEYDSSIIGQMSLELNFIIDNG